MKQTRQTGFTIVELLIVIVVIGILAAITIVAFNGVSTKAHDAALKSDLSNARTTLGLDNAKSGSYPADTGQADDDQGLSASGGTSYQYTSNGDSYCLTATSDTPGVPAYHIDSADGGIKDGPCPGDSGPGGLVVSTLAGSSDADFANGAGSAAKFNYPEGIALDSAGTIYVADYNNSRVRKVTPAGVVTTFAGSDTSGQVNGAGAAAQFMTPSGIAVDSSNNVYVSDYLGSRIRKITPAGVVTTFAGSTQGFKNDNGVSAQFKWLNGLAVDSLGNVYACDSGNDVIRKITPSGVVTTFAGSGTYSGLDGQGVAAGFAWPTGIAVDSSDNLYVTDRDSNRIRKITPSGYVTTIAGSGAAGAADGIGVAASFSAPGALTVGPSGNIYVADGDTSTIRRVTPAGVVTTIAGSGVVGFSNGVGIAAKFNYPGGITVNSAGIIYVSDSGNNRIRMLK